MSGQAYNGAHSADIGDFVARRANLADLERLHRDLKATPECEPLADTLLGIIGRIREQRQRIEKLDSELARLFAPLHDFAWWQSADGSEDNFRQTLAKWKAER